MSKFLLKPYIFIGTFVTAGITITTVYTIINFSNSEKLDVSSRQEERWQEEVQQVDYSNEIVEFKNTEEKTETLKEKNEWKENNSKIITGNVAEVQEKTLMQNNTPNSVELENDNNNQKGKVELLKEQAIYLEQEKNNIKAQIQNLKYATPMFNIEGANIRIEELEQKINLTTKENEKEFYRNSIEKIKQQIEENKRYLENLEKLESQLTEIENRIKEIEDKIKEIDE